MQQIGGWRSMTGCWFISSPEAVGISFWLAAAANRTLLRILNCSLTISFVVDHLYGLRVVGKVSKRIIDLS